MAFDEGLAERLRPLMTGPGVVEKKMFGGLAFLVRGNMSVGIHADELIVRADPEQMERLLREPEVRPFEVGGRSMKGWLLVAPQALAEDDALERWVELGRSFAQSLPPKAAR
jgi:TfoX/Sxy family transcriptional regulator of competence genes